ncbi:hypothetical protein HXX76_014562 [Chlamydomonas incerta]|uniref:RING-type E3 ubiquitin transferase n=1 Tax=Chlamydomonas incerta TaxID=51695 RepID=A0A835SJ01_CHLIN|nr:hypothetical protein HXX76_014562 [Chlamydomonas incerta]|eukprot:KAG2424353.1 hypothetical protein HXX76_014562 [Chlamydomonas incerta]
MPRLALLALLLALALGPALLVEGLQTVVAAAATVPHDGDAASTRALLARPLHDAAAGSAASDGASGTSTGGGGAAAGAGAVTASGDSSVHAAGASQPSARHATVPQLHRNHHASGRLAAAAAARRAATPPPPPSPPAWELELAPAVAALYPARGTNGTALRGPPRLVGTYKGKWLQEALGPALAAAGYLTAARGAIILQLPEADNPPPAAAAATASLGSSTGANSSNGSSSSSLSSSSSSSSSFGGLPGGVQELKGELVLRDGPAVTDRDLRFRLRGVYVPAAGAVHAVLEPHWPTVVTMTAEEMAAEQAAAAAASGGGEGGGATEESAAGEQSYREALRTAARQMALSGSRWYHGLIRASPPPPPPPAPPPGARADGRRRGLYDTNELRAAAAAARRERGGGGGGWLPRPPSPPPSPPLELSLRKACEFRAHFHVYYKGDPDASSHVSHLRLDVPAPPPPSPPPRVGWFQRRAQVPRLGIHSGGGDSDSSGGGGGAQQAGLQPSTGGAVGVNGSSNATGGVAVAAAVAAGGRGLLADTEIFHSTQMQLHGAGGGGSSSSSSSAGSSIGDGGNSSGAGAGTGRGSGSGSGSEHEEEGGLEGVYGLPPGMDPNDPDLDLIGALVSPNCGLRLAFNATSVHLERYYRQVLRYSVMVTAVTIGQVVLVVVQMESASAPTASARTSLYSVTLQAILDAYQCLLHLTGALVVDALFGAFASVAFLQFLLFAVFEMRQTLLVWRAQRAAANPAAAANDYWSVRRDMSAVYTRFYGLLLLGLFLVFQLQSHVWLLALLVHSWWLPQVVHSAVTDTRPPLKHEYLWGLTALRAVSPLYFWGCPSNLLRITPRPWLCGALLAWLGAQAGLLAMQMKWGPRVFIPKVFLPQRYDYHRAASRREMGLDDGGGSSSDAPGAAGPPGTAGPPGAAMAVAGGRAVLRRLVAWLRRGAGSSSSNTSGSSSSHARRSDGGGGADGSGDVETGHGSKECVICMNPVPLLPPRSRMVTPCGHFFHEPCLSRWIAVNSTCPTCRRPLPPP